MKAYAGIGSRSTPKNILDIMTKLATKLEKEGWFLRSGGACGADTAFALGTNHKVIYRPEHAGPKAIELAEKFHPAWHKCGNYAKKLHGRNMLIILGSDLKTSAKFVVCWTPSGKLMGGTAQGIRAAQHYKIPVFNLGREENLSRIKKYLG